MNLSIYKDSLKKCTPPFYGTHVICYIKFKLLYKFRIVAFFILSKYKYNAYIIKTWILR